MDEEALDSIRKLLDSSGWKILEAYWGEKKTHFYEELRNLDPIKDEYRMRTVQVTLNFIDEFFMDPILLKQRLKEGGKIAES